MTEQKASTTNKSAGRTEPANPAKIAMLRTQRAKNRVEFGEVFVPYVLGDYSEKWYEYDPADYTEHYDWPEGDEDALVIEKHMLPTKYLEMGPEQFEFGQMSVLAPKHKRPPELPCVRCHLWYPYEELYARTVTWVELNATTFRKFDMMVLGVYCNECRDLLNRMAGVEVRPDRRNSGGR